MFILVFLYLFDIVKLKIDSACFLFNMAPPTSQIFQLHFCTLAGSGDVPPVFNGLTVLTKKWNLSNLSQPAFSSSSSLIQLCLIETALIDMKWIFVPLIEICFIENVMNTAWASLPRASMNIHISLSLLCVYPIAKEGCHGRRPVEPILTLSSLSSLFHLSTVTLITATLSVQCFIPLTLFWAAPYNFI